MGFKTKTNIKKIKELRKKYNLTQTDLQNESGISLSTIKSIETGRIELSEKNAEILSRIFGVPCDDFYYEVKKSKVISLTDKTKKNNEKEKLVELQFQIPHYLEDYVIHKVKQLVENVI